MHYWRKQLRSDASDLHMVPGFAPMLRVKGDLVPTKYNQLSHKLNEQLFFEIIMPEQQDRLKTNLELDYAYELRRRGPISLQFFLYDARYGRCFPADPVENYDS